MTVAAVTYDPAVYEIGEITRSSSRRAAIVELAAARAGGERLDHRTFEAAKAAAAAVVSGFDLDGHGEIANRLGAATSAARRVTLGGNTR